MKLAILFSLCVLCVGMAVGQTATPEKSVLPNPVQEEDRYRIGFQDILEIQVARHPDLNTTVAVGPSGTIVLYRLERPIVAVCRTERELAGDIANAYSEKYLKNPYITVRVSDQKSQSFAVMGAVEKPGNYYISRKVHLLELLAMAGGPNKESGTRLLVARTGSSYNCRQNGSESDDDSIAVLGYKIRDVQEGRETLWMKPGDIVSVFEADMIYMYGNLRKEGALRIRDPITLTQAIASAEGLKPATDKSKIRILRQVSGKAEREEFVYDLNQIDKGKVKDPYLEPNDIVAVSQDRTKSILLGVGSALKNSVPNVAYRLPGL
ncbi:MAG: polysaccharide biosynthesis/export family protein [Pyrinomonadaceae bacterium]